VVERAIRDAPVDCDVALGEPATAGTLYEALAAYEPDETWVQSHLAEIESSYSLAYRLSDHKGHPRLETEDGELQQLYVIRPSGGDAETVAVDHPRDLLQLPCYQNLDERLQDEGPTRKELYDLVRKAAWLPEYRSGGSPDVEQVLHDIKELFSRWPWYDPTITEQQVRYELREDATGRDHLDGNEPLPMGCENPDMQQYCIGQDECSYSIYGSLPFDDDLYAQLKRMDESAGAVASERTG
jgi:hypothetical protein